jgi:hypothetical protein
VSNRGRAIIDKFEVSRTYFLAKNQKVAILGQIVSAQRRHAYLFCAQWHLKRRLEPLFAADATYKDR